MRRSGGAAGRLFASTSGSSGSRPIVRHVPVPAAHEAGRSVDPLVEPSLTHLGSHEEEAAQDEARAVGARRRELLGRAAGNDRFGPLERLGDELERVSQRVRALALLFVARPGLGIVQDVERKVHVCTLSRCRRSSKQRTPSGSAATTPRCSTRSRHSTCPSPARCRLICRASTSATAQTRRADGRATGSSATGCSTGYGSKGGERLGIATVTCARRCTRSTATAPRPSSSPTAR